MYFIVKRYTIPKYFCTYITFTRRSYKIWNNQLHQKYITKISTYIKKPLTLFAFREYCITILAWIQNINVHTYYSIYWVLVMTTFHPLKGLISLVFSLASLTSLVVIKYLFSYQHHLTLKMKKEEENKKILSVVANFIFQSVQWWWDEINLEQSHDKSNQILFCLHSFEKIE